MAVIRNSGFLEHMVEQDDTNSGRQFVGRMEIAPTNWLLGVQLETDSHLVSMRAVLRSIDDGTYQMIKNRRGNPNLILFQVEESDSAKAAEQALFDTFQAIMRSYSKYLDALIALKKLKAGIVVDRDLSGEEQITAYVLEWIEGEALEVAADRGRPLPVKVREIGNLPEWLLEIVDGYVAVRNAIEHHHRMLRKDVPLIVHRVAVTDRNGNETVRLGDQLEKGDLIGFAWLKHAIHLNAGTRLRLTEETVELVAFTLKNRVFPVLFEEVANPGSMTDLAEFPELSLEFMPEVPN